MQTGSRARRQKKQLCSQARNARLFRKYQLTPPARMLVQCSGGSWTADFEVVVGKLGAAVSGMQLCRLEVALLGSS